MNPILVTGTDTGVGKTVIAAHLLRQLRAQQLDAAYWKPVETGMPDGVSADCSVVREVAGPEAPATASLLLPEPLAPNVAARRAGTPIDLDALDQQFEHLNKMYAALVIEGAGGVLVYLDDDTTFLDLAARWSASVLLVVANRLGCLNHACLSIQALRQRGVPLGGWVLNHVTPPATIAQATNADELTRLLGPPLAVVDFEAAEHARLVNL